jgi:hypothetical protein
MRLGPPRHLSPYRPCRPGADRPGGDRAHGPLERVASAVAGTAAARATLTPAASGRSRRRGLTRGCDDRAFELPAAVEDEVMEEQALPDERPQLVFTYCHPALALEEQVVYPIFGFVDGELSRNALEGRVGVAVAPGSVAGSGMLPSESSADRPETRGRPHAPGRRDRSLQSKRRSLNLSRWVGGRRSRARARA